MRDRLTLQDYKSGLLGSDRIVLAKAITLVESSLPSDQEIASELIDSIIAHAGKSIRIGISGVPGVGKSTFIEAFGKFVTEQKKKIAILTIDPSSQLTKGSILGDKTRMEALAKNKLAFIRPSSSGQSLGGVAQHTRESILLCEAAGYEIIIVETVGVGQSEVSVKNMVDFFLLLMLPGAGDELQGIKKGIMEIADLVAVTKADGENSKRATEAQADYQHALHLQSARSSGWTPKVLTCSAYTGAGIEKIWEAIKSFASLTQRNGYFQQNRANQNVAWFQEQFRSIVASDIWRREKIKEYTKQLESMLSQQTISPGVAAKQLLQIYHDVIRGQSIK